MTTSQGKSDGVRKSLLASAIAALIATPAAAAETLLTCVYDADPGVRFNVRIDVSKSALVYMFRGNSHRYRATITGDHIEFRGGILITRINRIDGEFVVWNAAGKQVGIGTCRKMAAPVIH